MKLSFVAADVNFMSDGTPSLAWMFVCTFIPPFFLPVFGLRPTPLKSRLENNDMVVESMICRRLSQDGTWRFRLSEVSSSLYRAYKLRYVLSNTASGLRALASDNVLRFVIMFMPR